MISMGSMQLSQVTLFLAQPSKEINPTEINSLLAFSCIAPVTRNKINVNHQDDNFKCHEFHIDAEEIINLPRQYDKQTQETSVSD